MVAGWQGDVVSVVLCGVLVGCWRSSACVGLLAEEVRELKGLGLGKCHPEVQSQVQVCVCVWGGCVPGGKDSIRLATLSAIGRTCNHTNPIGKG
jgi:hypothetical protein